MEYASQNQVSGQRQSPCEHPGRSEGQSNYTRKSRRTKTPVKRRRARLEADARKADAENRGEVNPDWVTAPLSSIAGWEWNLNTGEIRTILVYDFLL